MTLLKKTHILNFIVTALVLALLGLSTSFVKKNFDQSNSNISFEIEQEGNDIEDDSEFELGLNLDKNDVKNFRKIFTKTSNSLSPQALFLSVPTSPPNC